MAVDDQYARKVPLWVIARAGAHFAVLVAIAGHADPDGVARPGMRCLADIVGRSAGTVAGHIAALLAMPELLAVATPGGPRRANTYLVPWLSTDPELCAVGPRITGELCAAGPRSARGGAALSARSGRAEQEHEQEHEQETAPHAPTPEGWAIAAAIRGALGARGQPSARLVARDYGLPLVDGRPVRDVAGL